LELEEAACRAQSRATNQHDALRVSSGMAGRIPVLSARWVIFWNRAYPPSNFISLPLQMSPEDGRLQLLFSNAIWGRDANDHHNECEEPVLFYYYVDLELNDQVESGLGRFHAQWRREQPKTMSDQNLLNEVYEFGGLNVDGKENYTILEAEGRGHYVGCLFSVYNLRRSPLWDWYGEGDDMIFVEWRAGFFCS
jgi:D-arabinan exo alpha-(1,3)/(1,5)-arabinofuranosidase (non-reducing end)